MELMTAQSLKKYPVWRWDSTRENQEPIKDWDSSLIDEESELFIRATFVSPDDYVFEGYITSTHAIGIFFKNEEYCFNVNLPDFTRARLAKLSQHMKKEITLFPLRFTMDLRYCPHKVIEGIFSIEELE